MFCPNCGFEIADSSKFCCECGAPIPKKEPIVLTTHEDEIKKIIEELKKKVWYYIVDLKAEGPFTDDELSKLFEEGTVTDSTEIWHIESDEVIPYAKKDTYGQTEEIVEQTDFVEAQPVEETEPEAIEQVIFDQNEELEETVAEPIEEQILNDEIALEEEIVNDEIELEDQLLEENLAAEEELLEEEMAADIEIIEDQLNTEEELVEESVFEDPIEEESITDAVFIEQIEEPVEEEYVEKDDEPMEEAEEPKWYYVDATHTRQGPITESLFHSLIDEGIIHAMTYIWTPGMQSWVFLKDSAFDSKKDEAVVEKVDQNEAEVFAVDQYWEEEPENEEVKEEPVQQPVETNWYYVDRTNMRQGPVSTDQIYTLIKDGVIHERTYLWTSGMAGWELMKDTDFYQPEPEQSKDWYYIDIARVRQGKFSDSEMEALLSNGTITENKYVWKAGMPQWALLSATELSKKEQQAAVSQPENDEPWFYRGMDNSRVGPFTIQEIEELLNRGTISYQTDVWRRGMSNWKPLSATELVKQPVHEEVKWYVQLGGQTMGPYPQSTVIQMLRNKEINARTYVWCSGMNDWEQLRDTPLSKMK